MQVSKKEGARAGGGEGEGGGISLAAGCAKGSSTLHFVFVDAYSSQLLPALATSIGDYSYSSPLFSAPFPLIHPLMTLLRRGQIFPRPPPAPAPATPTLQPFSGPGISISLFPTRVSSPHRRTWTIRALCSQQPLQVCYHATPMDAYALAVYRTQAVNVVNLWRPIPHSLIIAY